MTDERRGFFKRNGRDYELSYSLGDAQPYKVRFYRGDAWRPFETAEAREAHIKAWFAKNVPLGYEEAVHGDDPGPLSLTTCTGCGEPQRYVGTRKGKHCQKCGKPYEADMTNYRKQYTNGVYECLYCGCTWGDRPERHHADCPAMRKPLANSPATLTPPRIAPDEVLLKRALVEEVLEALAWVADLGTFDIAVNYGTMPDGHRLHEAIDAALAAASGDDGGTT